MHLISVHFEPYQIQNAELFHGRNFNYMLSQNEG